MNRAFRKYGDLVFVGSLAVLILNDVFLKTYFHNAITGKLSDFAGLLAFPYFFSRLFPRRITFIHVVTAVVFIWWKSDFSQPFINLLNAYSIFIGRTVDASDNFALVSIAASFFLLKDDAVQGLKPVFSKLLIIISCWAFMATSMPPRALRKYIEINKTYSFNFSKRELVARINMLQVKEIRRLNGARAYIDFDDETNVFHFHGQKDTLALLLDYRRIHDQDTIRYKTSFAEIMITDNGLASSLTLVNLYRFVPLSSKKDFREKAIRQFENRVVKQLRK